MMILHLAFARQAIIFSRESKYKTEVKRYYTRENFLLAQKIHMNTFQNIDISDRMGSPYMYNTGRKNAATLRQRTY